MPKPKCATVAWVAHNVKPKFSFEKAAAGNSRRVWWAYPLLLCYAQLVSEKTLAWPSHPRFRKGPQGWNFSKPFFFPFYPECNFPQSTMKFSSPNERASMNLCRGVEGKIES